MSIEEKLTVIAENEQKVYDAGKEEMNKTLWTMFSRNEPYMFRGVDFSHVGGFNPPFQLKPKGDVSYMFYFAKNMGVITAEELDFSEVTSMNTTFDHTSGISEIELMDLRNATNLRYMLNECYSLTKIGKVILKDDGTQDFPGTFNAWSLADITFEGKIGNNISFSICSRLTYESLISIINALKDYSGTGETRTLTLHATAIEKLSDADIAIIYSRGWSLVDNKGNVIT